jgi:hypothetical protein
MNTGIARRPKTINAGFISDAVLNGMGLYSRQNGRKSEHGRWQTRKPRQSAESQRFFEGFASPFSRLTLERHA